MTLPPTRSSLKVCFWAAISDGRCNTFVEFFCRCSNGIGIAVEGVNSIVSNQADIMIDGLNARAIEVTVGANDGFRVENSAELAVRGAGTRGLVVKGGAFGAGSDTISVTKEFMGCNPDPGSRTVANCADISLNSAGSRGIEVEAVKGASVENHEAITGAGREIIGMSVTAGASGALSDSVLNRVTNFDKINLSGE